MKAQAPAVRLDSSTSIESDQAENYYILVNEQMKMNAFPIRLDF